MLAQKSMLEAIEYGPVAAVRFAQVLHSAAEVYERRLVPALFQQWTDKVIDAADIRLHSWVADIACGTGVLARAAARRVGAARLVVGIDPNAGMLEVAHGIAPGISWKRACAESLPLADAHFDTVVSQFGLASFEDQLAGVREMLRILRPGGRLVLAVWDALEINPGFNAEMKLLDRLCGSDLAEQFRIPFSLGDPNLLRALFRKAGVHHVGISTHAGKAQFRSIRSWIYASIKGGTLATRVVGPQYAQLLNEADGELAPFAAADGSVSFDTSARVIVVQKG